MTNSSAGYGALTKLFHWLIVILFAAQYLSGNIMVAIGFNAEFAGIGTNTYYNWHKSLGLVALAVAIFRIINRRVGQLPPWAPTLSGFEKKFIHRVEQVFYTAMLVMPISGWLYVMYGHYGVNLFGLWEMPRPLPRDDTLRDVFKWVHIVAGWVLLAAMVGHIGLVLRHQLFKKDGLLKRML
ncbi:cytochrome b [Rhodobacteraceae bacterium N5(2021)]|uniref:Cytochrome b n=1 Tax=Gymnodinialimonas phycosphaerae TaxID=2841589 RepID=A0A975YGG1_9RHOB|nr:cytochrome b [Gymnodinialimonas phycosphaerae]MBY4891650.1 cytochrome b [Gymnodinialimonas phycosphaerae]